MGSFVVKSLYVNLTNLSKQTIYQVFGKAITAGSSILILGIIARAYGSSGVGSFGLSLTYLSIFYLVVDFGINAHFLKSFQALEKDKKELEFRKLLGSRLGWSVIVTAIAVSILPVLPFGDGLFYSSVLFGFLAIICSGVVASANLIFQSFSRYDLSVGATSLGAILSLALIFLFTKLGLPIPFLVLGYFLGWLVMAILAIFFVRFLMRSVSPVFDLSFTRRLVLGSWPIALTLVLNVVYFRIDAFMISSFRGVSELGIYNVAYQVFQSSIVLATFIMNAYYPHMSNSLRQNTKILILLFGLSVLGLSLTYALAPYIVLIIAGQGFAGSVNSLQILSLGLPAYFVSSLLMWLLIAKKYYKRMLAVYLLGLLLNFTANYLYIPQFGYVAASWTSVVSEYIIVGLSFIAILI